MSERTRDGDEGEGPGTPGARDAEARLLAKLDAPPPRGGPPPLESMGLVLHHDARWSHEGQPIRNRRLREHFDTHVDYLPAEKKFVVRLGHFRGQVDVEEAGFFVRAVDLEKGTVKLSDRSEEPLDVASLHESPRDGALLCRVKRGLAPEGLLARFMHGAQAELLGAAEESADGEGHEIVLGGERVRLPELG